MTYLTKSYVQELNFKKQVLPISEMRNVIVVFSPRVWLWMLVSWRPVLHQVWRQRQGLLLHRRIHLRLEILGDEEELL